MAFWSDTNTPEPLRQNRWYMTFLSSFLNNFTFALKETTKPSYTIETSAHVLINHTFNYPKNVVWKPINVTAVSVVGEQGALSYALHQRLKLSGYRNPLEEQDYQISKDYLSLGFETVALSQTDEFGLIVDYWMLYNCYITNVDYGSLSYESVNLVDIKLTLSYDYAELKDVYARKNNSEAEKQRIKKLLSERQVPGSAAALEQQRLYEEQKIALSALSANTTVAPLAHLNPVGQIQEGILANMTAQTENKKI